MRWFPAVALLLLGCPAEPDPENHEECKPGEHQCTNADGFATRQCTEDGYWTAWESPFMLWCPCIDGRPDYSGCIAD